MRKTYRTPLNLKSDIFILSNNKLTTRDFLDENENLQ